MRQTIDLETVFEFKHIFFKNPYFPLKSTGIARISERRSFATPEQQKLRNEKR
jgi:hypothetical protein